MPRKPVCLLVLVTAALGACGVHAQPYPSRPIRVIVPFPAGGAADIVARVIGPRLAERLGQQIVVENRSGASGLIGMELIARATPDGHTIGIGQGGNMTVAPHTQRNLSYDPLRDFAPIALVGTNYLALVSNPKAPFSSVPEMIAWARANPGKLSVGTGGEGTFVHLAFEQLRVMAGFTYTNVPYKGAAPATVDVIAGQIHVGISSLASFTAQLASGRLRLIALTNPVRVADRPELPIVADTVPGYDARGWTGYVAPAATPRAIVVRLNEEINRAMKLPEVADRLVAEGLVVALASPEHFAAMIRADHAKYGKLVRDIGFKAQ